jgi:uncharacterized protein (TIGR00255 family)
MPRSMTGFGAAEGKALGGRLRIEIRTVNHRYFNPQFRLPKELTGIDSELREALRSRLARGHVAVQVRWLEPPEEPRELTVDLERAKALAAAARDLKKKLRLRGDVDLAFILRQPDVLSLPNGEGQVAEWREVEPIVARAADEVVTARSREGEALGRELARLLDAMAASLQSIEARAPVRVTEELGRLRRNVTELLGNAKVDEQRLALELALMAERLDITEETVRFSTHLRACREALAGDGAVGKQLGFLSQELLREANTIGSKANDAAVAHAVITIKGELEKFREQLENLE